MTSEETLNEEDIATYFSPSQSDSPPPADASPQPATSPAPGGRVLPSNLAAEGSVLGAMLLSVDAVGPVLELLSGSHFFSKPNGYVFEAIAGLYSAGEPVDALTVAEELRRQGLLTQAGGEERLQELQTSTPVVSHAGRYARIVEEMALLRRLITASGELSELAFSRPADVTRALDEAEATVYAISERRLINSTAHLKGLLEDVLSHIDELYENGDGLVGVPTGFVDLDQILAGLRPATLNVVGGRPSMGKTAFALGIAAHVAVELEKPVLFFSLEMGHLEITSRLLASDARVDSQKLQTGQLRGADWDRIDKSITRLGAAQMWIDDNPHLTVPEVRAKSRRLARQAGELGLVVVDYLQLMSGRIDPESRQTEVAEMSRGLKILARELNTPVIAASQLSRNLEHRQDKRPLLSDLRESGSIEQDADVVMFLYRDEVYNPDSADKGSAEVIVAKHRNGPTGKAHLAFLPQQVTFANATPNQPDY